MKNTKKWIALTATLAVCAAFTVAGVSNMNSASADNAGTIETIGAGVRLSTPAGLRFISAVSKEYTEGYNLGTLVIPDYALGENVLEADTNAVMNIPKTKDWSNAALENLEGFDYDAEKFYFNAVLTDIPDTDYDTVIYARTYAEKDGVYYYGEIEERSIAQVAALALQNGETGESLASYVDIALAGKTLTMNVVNAYMVVGGTQTFDVLNDNGYAAIWTSSNDSVATVDKNGKVTAQGEGNATITAQIGTKTVTTNVQVGAALEGEKIIDVAAVNLSSMITPSLNSEGNGACELSVNSAISVAGESVMAVKSTSGYARINVSYPAIQQLAQYEKIQFYVYINGDKQFVTGAGDLSKATWTKAEIAVDSSKDYFTITFNEKGWNSNNGATFYVSSFYGVNSKAGYTGFKKIDINADNVSGFKQIQGGGTPSYSTEHSLKGEDGSMLVTVPTSQSYARVAFSQDMISSYLQLLSRKFEKLAVAVYLDASESSYTATQMIAFAGNTVNLTKNAWTWLVIDMPTSASAYFDLRDSGYYQSTGMKFYVSDFYAFNPTGADISTVVCDFNVENASEIAYAKTATIDSINGVLRGTAGSDYVDIYFNSSKVNLTGYKKLSFAVYTSGTRTFNIYNGNNSNRKTITSTNLAKNAWTIFTIDIPEGVTDLNQLSMRIYVTGWNGTMSRGEIFYISDIYGIK